MKIRMAGGNKRCGFRKELSKGVRITELLIRVCITTKQQNNLFTLNLQPATEMQSHSFSNGLTSAQKT
jgi:hypothetical protein